MAEIPEEKKKMNRAEKIEKLTRKAEQYLEQGKERCEEIFNDIVQTLDPIVCKKGWTVNGRVKNEKSLREKILRKGYYKDYDDGETIIDELPDLIGVRVQCLLNREEAEVYEILKNKREKLDEEKCSVYSTKNGKKMTLLLQNQPEKQKNGHEIYRIEGKYYCDSGQKEIVHFELQIKSMVHLFWGELEHSMFYKNYDFFISQKILTQSMDNILAELDLIDREMDGLQSNFSRCKADRINELKSVCVFVIQKEYQDKFNQFYGCDMDLRAAYRLIVEIKFKNTNREETAEQNLCEIIQRSKNADLANVREMIQDDFDAGNISQNKRECAEWLDVLVKEDVYWEAFFCMYALLEQKDDYRYKDWIKEIVECIQKIKVLNVFMADFSDSDSSDHDFTQNILLALILGSNGKLEYFMDEKNLILIQQKISESLKGNVFEKYIQGCEQEGFDKTNALKSIFLWTMSLIDFIVNGYIQRKTVEKLKECMDKENIFPVDIEGGQILENFSETEKLSGQKAKEVYKKLFVWEEEK